jgi:hypothetical protein
MWDGGGLKSLKIPGFEQILPRPKVPKKFLNAKNVHFYTQNRYFPKRESSSFCFCSKLQSLVSRSVCSRLSAARALHL